MTREVAHDMVEAVTRAGGRGHVYGPMATGAYGVSILSLPDVGLFMRALAHVGAAGRLTYSAGIGWEVVER